MSYLAETDFCRSYVSIKIGSYYYYGSQIRQRDKRWLQRDGNTRSTLIRSYKNPTTYNSFELTQECIEVEESGILDTWDEHDEVIDVDMNQNNNPIQMIAFDNTDSLTNDPKKKVLPISKVSKKSNYQDVSVSQIKFSAHVKDILIMICLLVEQC